MAYTSNIPQATDDPSQSQPLILGNFQEISTAFNLNHGNFNDSLQGKHLFMQMPEQSSAPTTSADEGALYTKEVGGATELFWREESNGTEYQFTNQAVKSGTGNIVFPGGLMMQWGSATVTSSGQIVTFGTAFPSAVYNVQLTAVSTSPSVIMSYASVTTSQMRVYASGVPVTLNYLATGS